MEYLLSFFMLFVCLLLLHLNGFLRSSNRSGQTSACLILGILLRSQQYSRKVMFTIVLITDKFRCSVRVTNSLHQFCLTDCAKQTSMIIYGQLNLVSSKALAYLMLYSWQDGSLIRPMLSRIASSFFLHWIGLRHSIASCLHQ